MPTVVAFECADGVVVAADRTVLRDGTVASRSADRVLDFGECGGAAIDDPDDVRRKLDAEIREYRAGRDGPLGLEPFTRLAREVLREVGTDAAVAARDAEGSARTRAVYADGSVIGDGPLALGSGAELALGGMEGAPSRTLDEAAEFAREVLAGVAQRDPRTGEDVDVWTLADSE